MSKKGGWTKRERELVRLWAAQISINRHRHQLASDSFAQTSFWLQLFCILVTAVVAVISFVSSYFDEEPHIVRALSITAGVLALCAGALNAIFARISPDTMSEQHRQTGIHYANYSNEIQSELVEDDDKLPPAREFLARIRNGVHLLHSFGPALDETTESDLPSKFLVQEYDGMGRPQPAAGAALPRLQTGYDIFKHDSETPSARAERRREALEQLRRDKEELAARKKAILEEEDDLQNAIAMNNATIKKARSSADVTQSMPVIPNAPQAKPQPVMSMPNIPNSTHHDNILNIDSDSDHADTLAHGSDTDVGASANAPTHHDSALDTMRSVLHGTAEVEAKAKLMRAELRRRYAALQEKKARISDAIHACENRTSELESVEDAQPVQEEPLQKSGVVGTVKKIKSALKKSFSPPPVTEEEVIAMETQRVRDLGFGEDIV